MMENTVNRMVQEVLKKYFSRGFMLNSPIETGRFRRFFLEETGQECPVGNENLENVIKENYHNNQLKRKEKEYNYIQNNSTKSFPRKKVSFGERRSISSATITRYSPNSYTSNFNLSEYN